jgi:hypothetical protein
MTQHLKTRVKETNSNKKTMEKITQHICLAHLFLFPLEVVKEVEMLLEGNNG